MSQPKQQSINVDLASAETITCSCGCVFFHQGFMLKRLSAFLSPTGREEVVPVQLMMCSACGKPLGMKTEPEEEPSSLIIK